MKQHKIKSTVIFIIALSSAVTTMQSHAEGNWYIGGRFSLAFVDEPGINEDDTGTKVFGGYKLNDYFAIEGGLYDFGEISDSGSHLEIDGLSLAAIGLIPVSSNVSLFGKVGIHDWDADSIGTIPSQLTKDNDTDAFYGVGLDYAVNERWSLRGEFERFEVDDLDIDVASIGVVFKF